MDHGQAGDITVCTFKEVRLESRSKLPRTKAKELGLLLSEIGSTIDLPKKLAGQREKIPTYRSIVRHFEQNGTVLQTCLKRLTEAETFIA